MWKEFIETLTSEFSSTDPATEKQIAQVEEIMQIELPEELKSLLLETNGLWNSTRANFVYSTSEIIESNSKMRTFNGYEDLFMPFDNLFIFGEDGGGDLFAFPITKNGTFGFGLFRWYHETDSRTSINAITLKSYIEKWLTDVDSLE